MRRAGKRVRITADKPGLFHRMATVDRNPCPRGAPLFCCNVGTFIGGPLQRGDRVEVYAVQPRKRLLWVRAANGRLLGFRPADIDRYDLQLTPPANPLSATARALSEGVANILTRAIGVPPS